MRFGWYTGTCGLTYWGAAGCALELRCQLAASPRTQDSAEPLKYSIIREDPKTSIETACGACHDC
jgi:hypothetical protein